MIRELAGFVAANLKSRKFPYPVTCGPELSGRDGFKPAIVFSRDRSTPDAIAPAVGTTRPRATTVGAEAPYLRVVSCVVVVYARSSKAGSDAQDHEDECDRVCDGVLTALRTVLTERKFPFTIVESKLLTRDDLRAIAEDGHSAADDRSGARSADFTGCAARIRFTVGTLVRDVTYPGASRPTGEVYEFADPVVEAEPAP